MTAELTTLWWWFGALFGVAWVLDVPVARRQWRNIARRFPAPPPPTTPVREFMYMYVWLPFTGLPMVRCWQCLVALEPTGIRFQRGQPVGPGYDILVPWALIDSCVGGVKHSRPYYVSTTIRLRDGGTINIQDPAGAAAWIQWQMERAHGPGTPIIGATEKAP